MAQGTAQVKVVTTVGKQYKQNRLTGLTANAFTYIALGTGNSADAAVGDTTLTTETAATGLARASVTPTVSSAGVATWTKTFTNGSGGSVIISEIGILNASSSGQLYIHATLGTSNFITLVNGASLVITVTDAE
jgi:hypothetical protein